MPGISAARPATPRATSVSGRHLPTRISPSSGADKQDARFRFRTTTAIEGGCPRASGSIPWALDSTRAYTIMREPITAWAEEHSVH